MNRRQFVKIAALSGATFPLPAIVGRASAAGETLYVADAGGAYTESYKKVIYTPFTASTGIDVVPVVRPAQALAQMKTMVETQNYTFDVHGAAGLDEGVRYDAEGLSERIELPRSIYDDLPDSIRNVPGFYPDSVAAFATVYRPLATKRDLKRVADIWDMSIPGVRSLRTGGRDNIEWALRADGVPAGPAIINELKTKAGWERAFRKLDEIKPKILTWWSTAPQSAQLLQAQEIDITATYANRAATLIRQGENLKVLWNEGYYTAYGYVIPKGNPKVHLVQKLIEFSLDPKRQAALASELMQGSASKSAFEFIDKKVLEYVPTQPDNFKQMVPLDVAFWGENLTKSNELFNQWLVK
ncbi:MULTISPECIES: extracellular solute-binding protein [Bradyrhizobium]|uniref:Extracellular solute-binding protein n=3 Tax=Bradyrhizobium TaxID=374 RepID=A0AAE6CCT9_9BRAD|nr:MULTISPECIES: extracellular solute-binding protein [Bradyrhizobium]MCG2629396.1 extracellular solute-binding protein [Bradyrhizobium zhengyangense]MCG2644677.1 extracellular solute-binding protein [Bradyrhizobium zhengyangense]MCG2670910.1 extracellular solute-binding protein [Bradyrhizobium zhengyangense]MDN4984543.1 extracellular solute-binding protein [Bradyrhizobium sp. WYCCWR 13022]MDN5002535.1 extracellular solute-binding protein [Bradyrhizobium sp. WYCCWR 12677]